MNQAYNATELFSLNSLVIVAPHLKESWNWHSIMNSRIVISMKYSIG